MRSRSNQHHSGHVRSWCSIFCCLAAWISLAAEIPADQFLRLTVHSGDHPRRNCPVTVQLPAELARISADWSLWEVSGDKSVPVPSQFLAGNQQALAWVLAGETQPNSTRRFEFRPAASPAPAARSDDRPAEEVTVERRDEQLEVRVGSRPVLRYHVGRSLPPDGIDSVYGRSGHIHPVWTPRGQVVSDEFPPDHPHQDGIFLAYVKTEFEGRQPDFWNLRGGTGFVRCAEAIAQDGGPVCGSFRVRQEHVDAGVPGGRVALQEFWDVRVWKTGGDDGWRFDIVSTLTCATDKPLVLKEYHYGGMAFRGARTWRGNDAVFSTSEGKNREAGNHTRVPWVDLSGKTGDEWAGLTMFTDPANFRFPEPVRLHPNMPYFVYTPSVLGDWFVEPDRPHVSRYHYHVHDGPLAAENAARIWQEISDPPRVALSVITE